MRSTLPVLTAVLLTACGSGNHPASDGGAAPETHDDASANPVDAGGQEGSDGGTPDAGQSDLDAGTDDGGLPADGGVTDGGEECVPMGVQQPDPACTATDLAGKLACIAGMTV